MHVLAFGLAPGQEALGEIHPFLRLGQRLLQAIHLLAQRGEFLLHLGRERHALVARPEPLHDGPGDHPGGDDAGQHPGERHSRQ